MFRSGTRGIASCAVNMPPVPTSPISSNIGVEGNAPPSLVDVALVYRVSDLERPSPSLKSIENAETSDCPRNEGLIRPFVFLTRPRNFPPGRP